MKGKKLFILLFLTVVSPLFLFSITYTPSNPNVGTVITFRSSYDNYGYNVNWNFGDGTTGSSYASYGEITHYYKNPGTYTVKAQNYATQREETISITINEDRYISVSPSSVKVNESVTITLVNAKSPPIRWDFGDGTIQTGSATTNHIYSTSGSYTIRAYDFNGTATTAVTKAISVGNSKQVTWTPQQPYEGQTVHFTATNFNSSTLQWDFGDGTIQTGSTTMDHVYKRDGSYTLKVYDYIGDDPNPFVATIKVLHAFQKIVSWTPQQPYEGQTVHFTATNFNSTTLRWDFGDGTIQTGSTTIDHIYKRAGDYSLRVYDNGGNDTNPVTVNIKVLPPPKSIKWTPQEPYEDQTVYFTAINFNSSSLRWDFGDGTVVNGSIKTEHQYQNPGVYTVRAYDHGGDDAYPATVQIKVKTDPRKLVVTNPNPGVTEPVIFQALNFFSDTVKWDFGDGIQEIGPPIITHRYRKIGTFKVKAYDYGGNSSKIFEITINVVSQPSHSSSLVISGIELFFKNNNKNYLIVPNGATNVAAKARIKYEGTGILNAYWLIDGQPYQLINRVLSFGQYAELYLEKIPALLIGYHTITIAFYTPKPKFEKIPELGLFVSPISKYVKLITPYDRESFAMGENIKFRWKKYPLAMRYAFLISNYPKSLLKGKEVKRTFINKTEYSPKIKFKEGKKYYWRVEAYDIDDNIIAKSEVREFKVVKSIVTAQEKERNELISLGGNKYVLLSFELNSSKIKKNFYYLVRVFVNNHKANEFVLKGEELKSVETSVKVKKGVENSIKLKIYEIYKNRLKLISYKLLKM